MRGLWRLYSSKWSTQNGKLHAKSGPQRDDLVRKAKFYYGNLRAYFGTANLPLFNRPRDKLLLQSSETILLWLDTVAIAASQNFQVLAGFMMQDIAIYFDRRETESGNDTDEKSRASGGDEASTFGRACDMSECVSSVSSKCSHMKEDKLNASNFGV